MPNRKRNNSPLSGRFTTIPEIEQCARDCELSNKAPAICIVVFIGTTSRSGPEKLRIRREMFPVKNLKTYGTVLNFITALKTAETPFFSCMVNCAVPIPYIEDREQAVIDMMCLHRTLRKKLGLNPNNTSGEQVIDMNSKLRALGLPIERKSRKKAKATA